MKCELNYQIAGYIRKTYRCKEEVKPKGYRNRRDGKEIQKLLIWCKGHNSGEEKSPNQEKKVLKDR